MASDVTAYVLDNRRNVAAWLIVAGIVIAVVILGVLDKKAGEG